MHKKTNVKDLIQETSPNWSRPGKAARKAGT